jgi:hypothetical protein
MNNTLTSRFLVACYNDHGFCRSMHFNSEHEARTWVQDNSGNYAKLVVEKNVAGKWSPARNAFVIMAWPRTGSSHLVHLLNSHGEILCNGEIFQSGIASLAVRWPKSDRKVGLMDELVRLRREDPEAFLDRILARDYEREYVGFKIFPDHNDEVLAQLVADTSIRKIILLRRNILAVFSSAMIARLTGQRKSEAADTGWRPAIEFAPEQFISFSAAYTAFYSNIFAKLHETRQPLYLHLYEDINNPDQIDRLVRFIGATPAGPLTSMLRKQNSADILSRFSNPDDVSRFLQAHDLDWSNERMSPDAI